MSKRKKQSLISNLSFVLVVLIIAGIFAGVSFAKKSNAVPPSEVYSVDDIEGKKIGVQLGTTGDIYVSDYEGDEAGTIIEKYNKGADAILALKQGKIDCVVIDSLPAEAFVAKNEELAILNEEFALEDYAMCVAKGNDTLREQINGALAELTKNGTLTQIVDYYINNEDGSIARYVSPEGIERNNGKLVVATNVAFPPYEYYESNAAVGIDMDMARAIADILGMECVIEDMEFDSIIIAVSSGKADVGIAGMTVTEDRLKNIDFTDTYATSKQVIIVRRDMNAAPVAASEVYSVDDIVGKKIGVQLGTTGDIYVSDYEGDEAGTIIEKYNKGADAILALKQAKIDCVVIDELPAQAFVNKNSDLSILDEEFTLEDYAMCVAKGNDTLRESINGALAELTKNGTLTQIVDYYINNEDGSIERYVSPDGIDRSNGTLTVATNVAFPPYEFYENNEAVGIDMDMARAIADILGMELKIEDMEFDSIIIAVSSGKADVGIAGMTITEDRLKNIDFTDTYATSKQVIIVRNGSTATGSAFAEKFKQNFIQDSRWKYLANGLVNTLIITIGAILIGTVLGFIIAIVRVSHDMNGTFGIWNTICKIYLTVMRGTPAVIQLLIIYYVIFASVNVNKVLVAVIAFGLNSAAYVAEVIRSGIMSVDKGQFEAGRSLGLSYGTTMFSIILPQAIKNTLPALGNEFIALLKETSISGYIGLQDLTKGGDIIRSTTWEAFMPYIAVAILYLIIVMALTSGVNYMERRLKKNER